MPLTPAQSMLGKMPGKYQLQKMAGKEKKFLGPAHFQVSPKKEKKRVQTSDVKDVRLLPPTEYKVGKAKDEELRNQKSDILSERISDLNSKVQQLKLEKNHLRSQLEKAKETELQLQEDIRRNKILLQRTRVDDAVDLRRLAETEEENLSLKTENRKQIALVSKLKTEIQNIRTNYEAELETYEETTQKQTAAIIIKQLKQELKQKDEKFETASAILERRVKKYSSLVKELNAELQKLQEQNESDRREFENILGNNEAQKYADMQSLKHDLRQCEQNHSRELRCLKELLDNKEASLINVMKDLSEKDNQLSSLMDECKELQINFQNELKKSKDMLLETQENYKQEITELHNELENCKVTQKSSLSDLQSRLAEKEKQLESQCLLTEQLRCYIGENLPDTKVERLQRENEKLNSHVAGLLQENEHLKSTVELLNVRLSSINELLAIQEQELEKSQRQTLPVDGGKCGNGLLGRWRSKVFALLVQLKSEKLSQQRKEQHERAEIKELKTHMQDLQNQCSVLDHSLVNKTAELKMEINKVASLERELQHSNKDRETIKTQLVNSMAAVKEIYTMVREAEVVRDSTESKLKDALSQITVFSQRTAFAISRIQFLQGLFARREAKWNREISEARQGKEEKSSEPVDDGLSHHQLLMEVERLTKERDVLTSEAKRDAEIVATKITEVRAAYEERLTTAASQLAQLESEYKDERERSYDLKERLLLAEEELKESSETVESLKSDLARHRTTAEKLLVTTVAEEQAKFTEQLATIEKQLNEIRKEHTKAVVALRQAERQVAREKEKAADEMQCQQMEFTQKIGKLKAQLQTVEKEKNMLMAMVRQEGLKLPRRLPATSQLSSSDCESVTDKENRRDNQITSTQVLSSNRNTDQCKSRTLDVAAALKDLESLSVAVLSLENE